MINETGNWETSSMQIFWAEIAPCEHTVQIYDNDQVFLDSLEGFIGSGIIAGESVVMIATPGHTAAIEERLKNQGFNLQVLVEQNLYISLDADEMLSKFMVNNWPDEKLFMELITSLLERLQQNNRKIRAFGEMVALLWEKGLNGATVQLENLWNKLHKDQRFTLFCAYPKIGFTEDIHDSMERICSAHSTVIDGHQKPSTEIRYKTRLVSTNGVF